VLVAAHPHPPTPPDDDEPPVRSRRLALVLGVLGAVSAVIAGLVIFSSGESTAPPEDPTAQVSTNSRAVVMGAPDAATKVVVFEDYGSRASREFEIASRDFLRVEAAQGKVRVEYHPFPLAAGYSRDALEAWGAVLDGGTAKQSLAFHDLLFDRQPVAGGSADAAVDFEAWAVHTGVERGVVSAKIKQSDSAFVDAARDGAREAGVLVVPTVRVNGRAIRLGTGIEMADQLQRRILGD
jgi:protein-disulfide isomerase